MAELLIKAVSAVHPDPTKDARGCYKRGDVVLVRPDDWPWGALESLPPAQDGKFVVVAITDVTPDQVVNWVRNHWDCEIDGGTANVRRRTVSIDPQSLPSGVRSTLNTTGRYATTWAAIRQYLLNKATAATAASSEI